MRRAEILYRITPWLIVLSAAASITGCTSDRTASAKRAGDSSPALASTTSTNPGDAMRAQCDVPGEKQIVRLVSRDATITITTGPHGPLYSARTAGGQMIVQRVTLDELRAQAPTLCSEVDGAANANAGTLIADLGD